MIIKSIAFHILKGGVGKTSLSGNIAYNIGKTKKTILIDCDIQANSTKWFLKDNPEFELADVLSGKIEVSKAIKHITNNLYILPTLRKNSQLKVYAENHLNQEPFVFEDLIQEFNKLGFEFAIFDLSPSISQLERCILLAINEVITPLTPECFSYDGIELFNMELQKINKSYRKQVRHDKIIINNINESFKRHKIYVDIISQLQNYNVFQVMQDGKIAEAQIKNLPIFEYSPKSRVIQELDTITKAVMEL